MKIQTVDCMARRMPSCAGRMLLRLVAMSSPPFLGTLWIGGTTSAFLWLGMAVLLAPSERANAQSVDYGTMEQMFGDSVTTSATGSPQRTSEVPADMVIITQDDIRRSGADNIPDILRFVPGIDVQQNGIAGADVGIRGYNTQGNPRLLVLLNGRTLYDDFEGGVLWNAIPVQLTEIRQIEIVKGPTSALFGFNAASGVINIVTYDPLYDKTDTLTAATGTQALASVNGVGTLRRDGVGGIRLSAGGVRENEFPEATNGGPSALHPKNAQFDIEGRWLIRPGLEATVEGSAVNENQNRYDGGWLTFDVRSESLRGEIADETGIGRLSLSGYRNEQFQSLAGLNNFRGNFANTVYDYQAADLIKIGAAHTVRVNFEYKDNTASSPVLLDGDSKYRDYAASAMWRWQISSAVSLTNAIRYDKLYLSFKGAVVPGDGLSLSDINAVTDSGVTFNSGLVWTATEADTFRLLFSRGLQLPSLLNLTYQTQGFFHLTGDPHLAPTTVTSGELGYDRTLAKWATSLHADVFAEQNQGLAIFPYDGNPVFRPPYGLFDISSNVGNSREMGLELSAKGTLPLGVRWNAGYTYTKIDDNLKKGLASSQLTSYQNSTPRNTVIFGLGKTIRKWELDAQARWQSSYINFAQLSGTTVPFHVGNYLTASARVGYQVVPQLTLAVAADQLLRERITEAAVSGIERRIIVSATFHL